MPVPIGRLRKSALTPRTRVAKSINEARAKKLRTAFLCHSHTDAEIAKGLANLLQEEGWDVYVDWEDASMPAKPDRTTAAKIKTKIISVDFFLFLATANSVSSRWCPWEIGFADGKKDIDKIWVVQTQDERGSYGNEYLDLYRSVDYSDGGKLLLWEAGQNSGGKSLNST